MSTAPFLSLPPGGLAPARCWWLDAADGVRLRVALWPAAVQRGHVVFLTGRTEYLEKVALPAAELVARGYSVVSLDWRGQGLSERLVEPHLKGHVGNFAEYQRDLDALLTDSQVRDLTGPRLLLGHSMGGVISLAALERLRESRRFDAAILSAPMLGISMNAAMRLAARATVGIGRMLGRLDRWPPFGDVETPYVLTSPAENVLTSDPAVWDWMVKTVSDHPRLGLAMPTLGWFDAALREMRRVRELSEPPCPTLCLLGSDETVIDADTVRAWSTRQRAALAEIPGGRHELLIEAQGARGAAWAAADAFLEAHQLPSGLSGRRD